MSGFYETSRLFVDSSDSSNYTGDLVPGGDAGEGLCEGGAVDQRAAGAVTQVNSQLRVRGETLVARVHLMMKIKIFLCCLKIFSVSTSERGSPHMSTYSAPPAAVSYSW